MPHDDELIAWLTKEADKSNTFATDLIYGKYGYRKRGYLTTNQVKAAEAMRTEIEAARKETAYKDTGIDLTTIPAGRYAVPNGKTRLKILIRKPGKNSNWHGWIFVSDAAEYGSRKKYGAHSPEEKTYQGQIQKELKAILSNPEAASIAYGMLTGTCGVCGRKLEDAISVANGIGPICADKLGWNTTPHSANLLQEL